MIRKITGKEDCNIEEGNPITSERIKYINEKYERARDDKYTRFESREEKFIR